MAEREPDPPPDPAPDAPPGGAQVTPRDVPPCDAAAAADACPCTPSHLPQSTETRLLCLLLDICADAMFSVMHYDPAAMAGTVLYASPGVLSLLGYTAEEYTSMGCA